MKVEEMVFVMGRVKKRVCVLEYVEGVGKGGCCGWWFVVKVVGILR